MKLTMFVNYLDKVLKAKRHWKTEKDNNKLIVRGKPVVRKVGVATNTSWEALEMARKSNVDLLIVHHRVWKEADPFLKQKLAFLRKHKISYYGAHESLDTIEGFGMGYAVAAELGIKIQDSFAKYKGYNAGVYGTVSCGFGTFYRRLRRVFGTHIQVYHYSMSTNKVAIVTGSGGRAQWMKEARNLGCRTFICGEANFFSKLYAKEGKLNLAVCGHYPTEWFGMVYLGRKIAADLGLNVIELRETVIE